MHRYITTYVYIYIYIDGNIRFDFQCFEYRAEIMGIDTYIHACTHAYVHPSTHIYIDTYIIHT